MLYLRVTVPADRAERVIAVLRESPGARRLTRIPTVDGSGTDVVSADLDPEGADSTLDALHAIGIHHDDYVLTREDLVGPVPGGRHGQPSAFAWVQVLGEARANARPLARYLVLMTVAAVIAGFGVINDNPILIIGAMAVSPDLLPVCAACVGLVAGRLRLARRALITLVLGLALTTVVAAALTAGLDVVSLLPEDFTVNDGDLGGLTDVDDSTIFIALAAGVAAMLAFQTRAAAAVGVAISVTTIPASTYLGVAIGVGEGRQVSGAILVLGANVACLILAGCATLAVQRWAARRSGSGPPRGTQRLSSAISGAADDQPPS